MGKERSDHELEVFRRFAVAAGLSRSPDCGEKRRQPEPDVFFENAGGDQTAFELVELLDEEYQNRIGLLVGTKAALQAHYESLPPKIHQEFSRKYGNALLYFRFAPGLTFKRRKSIIPKAFDRLLLLSDGFEGDFLEGESKLGGLDGVTISRGRFVGPVFDPESVGWVGDPTVPAIRKKFEKRYVTAHPIELLAYIESNPMFPDEVWLGDLEEFLSAHGTPMPFRRIWVFDLKNNDVKFRHPKE